MRVSPISYQVFTRRKKVEDSRKYNEILHLPVMLKVSDLSKNKAGEQFRLLQTSINEKNQEKSKKIIESFKNLPKTVQICIPIMQNDNNENIFILAVKNNQSEVALKIIDFVKTLPKKAQIDFAFIRDNNNQNQEKIASENFQIEVKKAFSDFVETLPDEIQTMTYQYYGPRQYYKDETYYGNDLDW